jgi:hypothetical protein
MVVIVVPARTDDQYVLSAEARNVNQPRLPLHRLLRSPRGHILLLTLHMASMPFTEHPAVDLPVVPEDLRAPPCSHPVAVARAGSRSRVLVLAGEVVGVVPVAGVGYGAWTLDRVATCGEGAQ